MKANKRIFAALLMCTCISLQAKVTDSSLIHPDTQTKNIYHNYIVSTGNIVVSKLQPNRQTFAYPIQLNRSGICPAGMSLRATVGINSFSSSSSTFHYEIRLSFMKQWYPKTLSNICRPRRACLAAQSISVSPTDSHQATLYVTGYYNQHSSFVFNMMAHYKNCQDLRIRYQDANGQWQYHSACFINTNNMCDVIANQTPETLSISYKVFCQSNNDYNGPQPQACTREGHNS